VASRVQSHASTELSAPFSSKSYIPIVRNIGCGG
jgi:hypothetical protein